MQSGERKEMKVSGSMLFMASIAASAVCRWRVGGIAPSYEAVGVVLEVVARREYVVEAATH